MWTFQDGQFFSVIPLIQTFSQLLKLISRGRTRPGIVSLFSQLSTSSRLSSRKLLMRARSSSMILRASSCPPPQIVPLPRMMILRQFGPVLWFMSPAFKRLE